MQRVILHMDLDMFFAACEERRKPELKGKPVVVCVYSGRSADSGAVSTANYEARKFGVKSGMPIAFAKKACPQAVYLPVDFELYSVASERIMEILLKYSQNFEQVGIDEAFLDLTEQTNGSFDKAEQIAKQIKDEIFKQEQLSCSIGIAPNKLIAKIASDFQKPNGLTIVKPEDVQKFLDPMSVRKIPGIGKKTEEALKQIKIETVEQLRNYGFILLEERFGKNSALWLKNVSQGIDESPVEQVLEAKQFSRITTLKKDTNDYTELEKVLTELASEIHERIMDEQVLFRNVGIQAIDSELKSFTRSKMLESPTNKLHHIKDISKELLQNLREDLPGVKFRRFGVRVANIVYQKGQKTLAEF